MDHPLLPTLDSTDTITNTAGFVSSIPGIPDCQFSSGKIICNLGSLNAGSAKQVQITITSPPATGPFPNIVDIKASEVDPNPANNTLTTTVLVN